MLVIAVETSARSYVFVSELSYKFVPNNAIKHLSSDEIIFVYYVPSEILNAILIIHEWLIETMA